MAPVLDAARTVFRGQTARLEVAEVDFDFEIGFAEVEWKLLGQLSKELAPLARVWLHSELRS